MPWLYSASALISCQFLFIDPMAMRPLLVLNRQLMRFELCFSFFCPDVIDTTVAGMSYCSCRCASSWMVR